MSRHHYETNPHFISQDQQPGGPYSSWTAPHNQPPSPPPGERHQQIPDVHPVAPPRVNIKTRGRGPRGYPTEPHDSVHEPPSSRPLPLDPEGLLPPRRSPRPSRPLFSSPEQQQRPQHSSHGASSPWWKKASTTQAHHRPTRDPPKVTTAISWSAKLFCLILWIILILGGFIILMIYLNNRPTSPYFDISAANLNSAKLEMGFIVNGDFTILVNFTNPSKKTSMDFRYVTFELYFYNALIATEYIEPFTVPKGLSMFTSVHLVSNHVPLELTQAQELQQQLETSPVLLELKGTFHARTSHRRLVRYSYWLHTRCSILLDSPPLGTMRARRCETKR